MPQQAANLNTWVTLEAETCCNCGMVFGIAADFRRRLLNEKRGTSFFCPAGHSQHYAGKSEADRLRAELAAKELEVAAERERVETWKRTADHAARSAAASRGHANRIRKRVQHGVCPCCNRTFANVARHMGTKHPHYAGQDIGS